MLGNLSLNSVTRRSRVDMVSLVDVLRAHAQGRPDSLAYCFLDYGASDQACSEMAVTYAELDRRARAIAVLLQGAAKAGDRVLLLFPAGVDYMSAFLGCLYAGVIAVPAYPPEYLRLSSRMDRVAADCAPGVVLSTSRVQQQSPHLFERLSSHGSVRWINTDDDLSGLEHLWKDASTNPEALAFLQYTSGSSGDPKGVMITHRNLTANLQCLKESCGYSESDCLVSWLPPYHDMGLIMVLLSALYNGFPCVAMSPFAFVQNPWRWLHQVSVRRGTAIGAPNFAYDLCVRKIPQEQRAELDLSCLRLAWCGAEPVRADTVDRFCSAFEPCGLRRDVFSPGYGLAESTVLVGMCPWDQPAKILEIDDEAYREGHIAPPRPPGKMRRVVGCGRIVRGHDVQIVDPERCAPRADREIGEVWVSGPSVTAGYWGKPEASSEAFEGRLASAAEQEAHRGPFLRTGDLGFLDNGELYIVGRIKDLIIVRGTNHYPQDIEYTVESSHPALRPGCGAAIAVDRGAEEHLVVVQEVRSGARCDEQEIFTAICAAVRENHEILVQEIVLLEPNGIPKTTSGKIARRPCRVALEKGGLPVWKSWSRPIA